VRAASRDFVGVQIYRQIPVPGKGQGASMPPPMPFAEGETDVEPCQARGPAKWNHYVYARDQEAIMVTENGIQTDNDARRVWYVDCRTGGVAGKHCAGVPVLGYFHCLCWINFEWKGYKRSLACCRQQNHVKRTPSQVQPMWAESHQQRLRGEYGTDQCRTLHARRGHVRRTAGGFIAEEPGLVGAGAAFPQRHRRRGS